MSTIVWLEPQTPTLPRPADQTSEVQGSQGRAPSTGSREVPSRLFQLRGLQASPGWWPRPSRLCLHLHAASPLSLCTLRVRKPLLGRRTTPRGPDLIWRHSLIASAESHLQTRWHSEVPRGHDCSTRAPCNGSALAHVPCIAVYNAGGCTQTCESQVRVHGIPGYNGDVPWL